MGSPVAPPSGSSPSIQRAANPQVQHLAAGARQMAPQQPHMQQRPQPGQQPPTQLQIPPVQTPQPEAGNASQPLPSPKVNLQQQQQLRQYMQTLPPEKRQEVWQQIQARNAAARSAQAAAAVGVMSPGGMQQHVGGLGQTPPGGQVNLGHGGGVPSPMGRGAGPQVAAGRAGRGAPAGRSRGMQMPQNAPMQNPAQLAAAAAIAQVAQTQLAGVSPHGGPQMGTPRRPPMPMGQMAPDESGGNPSSANPLQESLVSPSGGLQSPASYPYNLQQAQMMLQGSGGVSPVGALGATGVAPPLGIGQAPPSAGVDTNGRSPMQPGQASQPPDKQ